MPPPLTAKQRVAVLPRAAKAPVDRKGLREAQTSRRASGPPPPASLLRGHARVLLAEALPILHQRFLSGALAKEDVAYVRMLASIGVGERVSGLDELARRRGAVVLLPPRAERPQSPVEIVEAAG